MPRNEKYPEKTDLLDLSCCGIDSQELLGTGGYTRKGKTTKGKYSDLFYCPKCKRVYMDCHFHGGHGYGRGPYSPRQTRQFLASERRTI